MTAIIQQTEQRKKDKILQIDLRNICCWVEISVVTEKESINHWAKKKWIIKKIIKWEERCIQEPILEWNNASIKTNKTNVRH